MIDGDRLRLEGSHAQGLNSISRGRGVSSAAVMVKRAASAQSAINGRFMARRARAAATTMQAGLREGCR